MGRIRVLTDVVANKIAAGEVVERPASVAKELLENALDAQATRLRIEVEAGGKRLIRIADNGVGMGRDDAMLAFERHATSKLREVGDLLSISTLGFRGEALPSISSVSRLVLETACDEEPTGTRVEIAGGKMLHVDDTAMPRGTTITVQNLFYNVPARRKFLRTEPTELAHIASLVTHYSLAHIDKSFYLAHEKGELLNATPVNELRERVYQVFGADTLDSLVELDLRERELEVAPSPVPATRAVQAARLGASGSQRHQFQLSGFVSTPHVQKRNRNSIYIFVNRRLIRDRLLLHAISGAYHNLIPPGNFPFALLFLDMPCEEVDVNVHPSKTEVRFRHQSFVHDFVRDSIREQLIESKPVTTFTLPESGQRPTPQRAVSLPFSETSVRLNQDDALAPSEQILHPPTGPAKRLDFSAPPIEFSVPGMADQPADDVTRAASEPGQEYAGAEGAALGSSDSRGGSSGGPEWSAAPPAGIKELVVEEKLHSRAPLVDEPAESMANVGSLRPLGQIKESFIVASGSDGLWILDQHVVHERILFEKVLEQRSRGQVESQRLLMPIIITLRPEQEITFAQIEDEFRANGFDLEPFGNRTIAVKAAPAALSPQQVEALIHEILDTPERELRALSLDDIQRRVAATIACHAAIKVNTPLDNTKIHYLLDELAKTDCPMSCPHGRPVALKYEIKEILKAFHRI